MLWFIFVVLINTYKAMKTATIKLKSEFIMSQEDIDFLNSLPDNLPETKLKKADVNKVWELYHKYITVIDNKDWSPSLMSIEQGEKWPSGPRVKRHEAQRMVLGWLVTYNTYDIEMSLERANYVFYSGLTNRPAAVRLLANIYEVTPVYNI
jgi:hypothetical protein